MNKVDKDNIEELLSIVNSQLKEGSSIATIERELNFGKDTLRRKLNRAGYKYNKDRKRFIFDEDLLNKFDSHNKSTKSTKNPTENTITTTKNIAPKEVEHINNTPITQETKRALTDEDFEILLRMIDDYKLKEKRETLKYEKNDSTVITRSFRSYKQVLDNFANFCKKNNLAQKDAVADAFILYMRTRN